MKKTSEFLVEKNYSVPPKKFLNHLERLCKPFNQFTRVGEEIAPIHVIQKFREAFPDTQEADYINRVFFASMPPSSIHDDQGIHPILNRQDRIPLLEICYKGGQSHALSRTFASELPSVAAAPPRSQTQKTEKSLGNFLKRKRQTDDIQFLQQYASEESKALKKKRKSTSLSVRQKVSAARAALQHKQSRQPLTEQHRGIKRAFQSFLGSPAPARKRLRPATAIPTRFFILPHDLPHVREHYQKLFRIVLHKKLGLYRTLSLEAQNAFNNSIRLAANQPVEEYHDGPDLLLPPLRDGYGKTLSVMPVHLRSYQTAICHSPKNGLVLFHEAGTGKTLTALAAAVHFLTRHLRFNAQGQPEIAARAVIAAPVSTVNQVWVNEVYDSINVNVGVIRSASRISHLLPEYQFLHAKGSSAATPEEILHDLDRVCHAVRSCILICSHNSLEKSDEIVQKCGGLPALFILDEAHNLNSVPVSQTQVIPKHPQSGYHAQLHLPFYVYRLLSRLNLTQSLFLTATPIVNALSDVNNFLHWIKIGSDTHFRDSIRNLTETLFLMAAQKTIIGAKDPTVSEMRKLQPSMPVDCASIRPGDPLSNLLRDEFHVIKRDTQNYPNAEYYEITCTPNFIQTDERIMAKNYEAAYNDLVTQGKLTIEYGPSKTKKIKPNTPPNTPPNTDLSTVYNKEIQASIAVGSFLSPAMIELLSDRKIRLTGGNRTVLYVAYDNVKNLLKQELRGRFHGLTVSTIDGSMSSEQRMAVAKQFNDIEPEVGHALIIMPAGTEGVNLKKVSNIVFVNQVWTQSDYEQIVGRGVRYRSHVMLPPSQQKVRIYNLYNRIMNSQGRHIPMADAYMTKVRLRKKQLCSCFEDLVK